MNELPIRIPFFPALGKKKEAKKKKKIRLDKVTKEPAAFFIHFMESVLELTDKRLMD